MKKIIVYFAILIAACLGCDDEQLTESSASKPEMAKDTIKNKGINQDNPDLTGFVQPQFNPDLSYGSITDTDGNIYKTIQIGTQLWMAENLKITHYNDGSPIYMGTGDMAGETNWFDLRTGAYCWYFNDLENKWMGAIYNWYALETGKLAPAGWHIPTNSEWETLISYLGGEKLAQDKLLSFGKDGCGFSAVTTPNLCGWGFGPDLSYWSATPYLHPYASVPYAYYLLIWEENSVKRISLLTEPKSFGFCVRCVKD